MYKEQKYKLLQSTIEKSDWVGGFTTLKEAQRVKRELEQEGVGIFRIVSTSYQEKLDKFRRGEYE